MEKKANIDVLKKVDVDVLATAIAGLETCVVLSGIGYENFATKEAIEDWADCLDDDSTNLYNAFHDLAELMPWYDTVVELAKIVDVYCMWYWDEISREEAIKLVGAEALLMVEELAHKVASKLATIAKTLLK
jgi:hypothetical protein